MYVCKSFVYTLQIRFKSVAKLPQCYIKWKTAHSYTDHHQPDRTRTHALQPRARGTFNRTGGLFTVLHTHTTTHTHLNARVCASRLHNSATWTRIFDFGTWRARGYTEKKIPPFQAISIFDTRLDRGAGDWYILNLTRWSTTIIEQISAHTHTELNNAHNINPHLYAIHLRALLPTDKLSICTFN